MVGELRRQDASVALEVLKLITGLGDDIIIHEINRFPGVGRRFEKIADGAYSDYGHHPEEIKATVKMALELKERENYEGLAVIYQPHQNTRQHKVKELYKDAFIGVDKLFWLPTYLTRENPNLPIISPREFFGYIDNPTVAVEAEANDTLAATVRELIEKKWLVVLITAGPADTWFRNIFKN